MNIKWETPQDFFNELDKEFHFDIDVCAVESDTKIKNFFSPVVNGLSVPWVGKCWMNPPYDRSISRWVEKAYKEAQKGGLIVCLLPGRSSDTKWFHDYVMKASEIRFVKGRIQFLHNKMLGQGSNISNILVIFRPYCKGPPVVSNIDRWGRPCNKPLHSDSKILHPIQWPVIGDMPDTINCPVCGTICRK